MNEFVNPILLEYDLDASIKKYEYLCTMNVALELNAQPKYELVLQWA